MPPARRHVAAGCGENGVSRSRPARHRPCHSVVLYSIIPLLGSRCTPCAFRVGSRAVRDAIFELSTILGENNMICPNLSRFVTPGEEFPALALVAGEIMSRPCVPWNNQCNKMQQFATMFVSASFARCISMADQEMCTEADLP